MIIVDLEKAEGYLENNDRSMLIDTSKHDADLLDKVADRIKSGCTCTDYSCGSPFNKDCANCSNYMIDYPSVIEVITELKAAEKIIKLFEEIKAEVEK